MLSWSDGDLRHHAPLATSQRDLAIRLGLKGNSGIPQVMRRADALGLDTRHLRDTKSIRDRAKRVDDQTLIALVLQQQAVMLSGVAA
jgi:hypothetical protein